jgi:hypothetical protein
MPLGGWTCDELRLVFGLSHASKASQAFDPAVTKIARAMIADPRKTLAAIHEAMESLEHENRPLSLTRPPRTENLLGGH